MSRLLTTALIAALPLTLACEGPMGPEGPPGPQGAQGAEGPQGPPGEDGQGTRITFQGTIPSGGAVTVPLPAEAGTMTDLPVALCYISSTGQGAWLLVADGFSSTSTFCGLREGAGGALELGLLQGPPGWAYFMSVVY